MGLPPFTYKKKNAIADNMHQDDLIRMCKFAYTLSSQFLCNPYKFYDCLKQLVQKY